MSMVTSAHVWLDEKGTARVGGHKIRQIVVDYIFNKWSPEVIHQNFPDLSLAEIHGALAYYYDNKRQIDTEIEEGDKLEKESMALFPPKFTRKELEARLKTKTQ